METSLNLLFEKKYNFNPLKKLDKLIENQPTVCDKL